MTEYDKGVEHAAHLISDMLVEDAHRYNKMGKISESAVILEEWNKIHETFKNNIQQT